MQSPSLTTRHILLCATQRTGSNLLEMHLRHLGVAGKPREYYSPTLAGKIAKKFGIPAPEANFEAYAQSLQQLRRTENGVFSVKVMYHHLKTLQNWTSAPSGWDALRRLHPDAAVAHVTRRDKLRQAISMVMAKQSGIYTSIHIDRGQRCGAEDLPGYDYWAIRHFMEKFEAEDAGWQALLAEHESHGGRAHRVVFEDFIQDPKAAVCGLLAALEIPIPPHAHAMAVPMRRQATGENDLWAQRFAEEHPRRKHEKVNAYRERQHQQRKAQERPPSHGWMTRLATIWSRVRNPFVVIAALGAGEDADARRFFENASFPDHKWANITSK
jgi:trehalose 2-sulfotransferase